MGDVGYFRTERLIHREKEGASKANEMLRAERHLSRGSWSLFALRWMVMFGKRADACVSGICDC